MRFSVRRMIAAVAVVALIFGVGVQTPRAMKRWQYCHELAQRHAVQAKEIRKDTAGTFSRVQKLDEVARRCSELGREPRPIDDLVRESNDPAFAGWFVKNKGRRQLLSEDETAAPADFIRFIEQIWGRGWRERASAEAHRLAYHDRMEQYYLDAAYLPWRKLPQDPPTRIPRSEALKRDSSISGRSGVSSTGRINSSRRP